MKNPILAAILNAVVPGVGYLYIGVRKRFAILLVAGVVLSFLVWFDSQSPWYLFTEQATYMSPWEWISLVVIAVAFGYDAYTETKALTPKKS